MKNSNSDHFLTAEKASKMPEYDPTLPPLSGEILGLFDYCTPRRTMDDFVRRTGAHRNTIMKRIGELIRAGLLRKHGRGKATWYTL